ncbi:hypothetical protein GCM10023311_20630 [Flaviramulus aquimarinus]|uniref:Signal transduction histidine kinase internal region domain-containing protein n=1 Tax=Flaviramulus aquimarinus TaxID=1170456 RepID=A0ABP9F789_9FLAO
MDYSKPFCLDMSLFYLAVFFITLSFSQPQKEIDSLILLLENNTQRDSVRVRLLLTTSFKLRHKDLNEARSLVDEALDISSELKWIKGKALSLRQSGMIYYREGNSLKAVEVWYDALKKSSAIKEAKDFELTIYGNLANVYADSGEFEQALDNYNKFLELAKKLNNRKYQIQALTNIGTLLTEKETRIKEGIQTLEKALAMAKKENIQQYVVSILLNIGLSHKRNEDYSKALTYYQQANKLSRKTGDKYVELLTLNNLCNVNISLSNYHEAEIYAKNTLNMSKEMGSIEWQSSAWESLSHIYETKNNSEKALNAYKKHIKLNDSFASLQNKEKIAKLEAEYQYNQEKNRLKAEADKKQLLAQEEINRQKLMTNTSIYAGSGIVLASIIGFILYRRKQDAVVKSKEAEFKTKVANTELKVLRAQMNPHFIFNSLNSIGSYILNNDTDAANNYLTKFSKLMRHTLENSEREEISLEKDIELLKTYLDIEKKRFSQGFNYDIKIDDALDTKNTLIPPMILQPFVENSIWHGISKLEGNGTISIEVKKNKNVIIYSVDDNGIGRKKSRKSNPSKKESLGIKITKNRIDIINKRKNVNANLKIIDKENGTRVEVTLPLELEFTND